MGNTSVSTYMCLFDGEYVQVPTYWAWPFFLVNAVRLPANEKAFYFKRYSKRGI